MKELRFNVGRRLMNQILNELKNETILVLLNKSNLEMLKKVITGKI